MARPKKAQEEKRTERFNLRYTIAERMHIEAEAAKAGLDPTEFQRRRSLGFHVSPAPQKVDAALLSELNRIGVNLNQLTHSVNANHHLRDIDPQAVFDELSAALSKVATAYDHQSPQEEQ